MRIAAPFSPSRKREGAAGGRPAITDATLDRCVPADTDSTRFRSRRRAQDIRYRFVAATGSCAAGG
jgi:hypothetical protein